MVSFLAGAHHQPDTGYDERDAQKLTHVKGHAMLKFHLNLLKELYKKAEGKDCGYAESEIESAAHSLSVIAVNESDDNKNDEIGDGLIKLGRVAWKIFSILNKDESPVCTCRLSHNL